VEQSHAISELEINEKVEVQATIEEDGEGTVRPSAAPLSRSTSTVASLCET
jgi:hypothetical protein